jgi:hypothetical protein
MFRLHLWIILGHRYQYISSFACSSHINCRYIVKKKTMDASNRSIRLFISYPREQLAWIDGNVAHEFV